MYARDEKESCRDGADGSQAGQRPVGNLQMSDREGSSGATVTGKGMW
jgi:hypothetical protein